MPKVNYYIDCEFDGHKGPLLSLAIVQGGSGIGMHIAVTDVEAKDHWVQDNVVPLLQWHGADYDVRCKLHEVGENIREFLSYGPKDQEICIVADSPVDIGRFCKALTTNDLGEWESTGYPTLSFEVHNVDCYDESTPEYFVQHNAYWDAVALGVKLGEDW